MTDFADWQSPQAIATHVSLTGVPLLRLTNVLANGAAVNVPAAGSIVALPDVEIDQPSYEMSLSVNLPAGVGTVPFLKIVIIWSDFITGTAGDTEIFYVPAGNGAANVLTCYLSGPARGSGMSVVFFNLDAAHNMTVSYDINATSHIYDHDRLFQASYAVVAPIFHANPGGIPDTGVLFAANPLLGPGVTNEYLIAAWNGTLALNLDNTGQPNSIAVTISDPATLYSAAAIFPLYKIFVAAGAGIQQTISLPNGPVLLDIHNNGGAGNVSPFITGIKIEY